MIVLGIETSCDETGIAIYGSKGSSLPQLYANSLFSQIEMHKLYGGVVPELASRDHLKRLTQLINQALSQAKMTIEDIDAIAYTAGPGLMGALLVGATFARSLAYSLNIPTIAINHLEGHLLAPFLEDVKPTMPFIGLLVSGGHSQIIAVNGFSDYELLGQTLDDAVGEAFDKTANILGLGYPGGAALSKFARSGKPDYKFTLPMVNRPGLEMSFSGLKTAALNRYNFDKANATDFEQAKANLAKAFEIAIVDTLVIKVKRALDQTGLTRIVIAGGVSANSYLREQLKIKLPKIDLFYARQEFCVDNGAMIAYVGYQRLTKQNIIQDDIEVRARWPLAELKL